MTIEHILTLSALILTCAALFSWLNAVWLRLPHSIAMVLFAFSLSIGVLALNDVSDIEMPLRLRDSIGQIPFNSTLLVGLLSFLLFAGSLHLDYDRLMEQKWPVLGMATLGTVISTALVGAGLFLLAGLLGLALSFSWCLVFGALISPTDPVAVISILKKIHLAPVIETQVAGESLFNDGVGVVLFTVLLRVAQSTGTGSHAPMGAAQITGLFFQEVGGGVVCGLAAGYLAFLALRRIGDHVTGMLITLALVTSLYSFCLFIDASGPLAVVVAGLMVGHHKGDYAMSERARGQIRDFWSLLEDILNSVLFVLVGFQLLVIKLETNLLLAAACAVPLVLLARFFSVAISLFALPRRFRGKGAIKILTWGGLRGGLSIAMALSLPPFAGRNALIILCYGVVVASIILQGLTIERLAKRWGI